MTWFTLTLLSVFLSSAATILQRTLMKDDKSNPYSYTIVFHFLLGLLLLVIGLINGSNFSLSSGNVYILLLAAALWGVCQVFLFKALQLVEASQLTIVSGLRVVITILASLVFLNQVFTELNVLGTILILAATFLVVNLGKEFKLNKGILYTLAMTFFGGLAIVADSANVQHYDVLAYSAYSNFLSGLCILVFYPKVLRQWKSLVQPSFLAKMLPLAVFSATQGVLYLLALTYGGNTAQVGTIRQASVIVTVLLAIIFLKERENLGKKFIAAVFVTAGIFLLS
ncbi:MAG: EamA family transporter [Candidatus Abawacabacteria bacterium]|nr:EamA family transporter [Candidatus Abawacabacteria bacterium]